MRTVKFGIIGLGLMGKEFASAAARWMHLPGMTVRPVITGICSRHETSFRWYRENIPTITTAVTDYRQLLEDPEIEAVYCAVPHYLHEEIYTAVLRAGKHLMGEKPFGIDLSANKAIVEEAGARPNLLTRAASQFIFYPAVQRIGRMIEEEAFGKIIEVNAGFLHSSDLDPQKKINWKRMVQYNGAYGVMGDLGMHVTFFPLRAGWQMNNVRAILSDIVRERPDDSGQMVPCETWDNATLLCGCTDPFTHSEFPMTFRFHRIAPGEKNTWYLEILGTRASARFSTRNPKMLEIFEYDGGEQRWQWVETGHETTFNTITGGIFETGFSDLILQMWASYLSELADELPPGLFARCMMPEETLLSHRLFTAALESHEKKKVVTL